MTPERRLQTFARRLWTRGDEAGAAALLSNLAHMDLQREQQQSGQAFSRDMNNLNFEQGLFMNDLQQQGQDARHQQDRQDRTTMWNAEQEAQKTRDAQQWQQQLTLFGLKQGADAMDAERQRQQQEQDATSRRQFGLKPVYVKGTSTPFFQDAKGSIYTGAAPTQQVTPRMIEGFDKLGLKPSGANNAGQMQFSAQPSKQSNAHIIYDDLKNPHEVVYNEDGTVKGYRKLNLLDANGDGIPDSKQMGGGGQGSLSGRPAQTTSGFTWRVMPSK